MKPKRPKTALGAVVQDELMIQGFFHVVKTEVYDPLELVKAGFS